MAKGKPRWTTEVKSTQIRWFLGSQAGEAGPCEKWPKYTQGMPKTQGGYQTQVQSGQMVLVAVVREAGTHEQWPRMLREKSENNFRQPKDLLKRQSDSPTKKESLFIQRMVKR
jgi:hypothetical protein